MPMSNEVRLAHPAEVLLTSETPVTLARRRLLGGLAGMAAASWLPGCASTSPAQRPAGQRSAVGLRAPKLDTVRFGVIGLGQRGAFLTRTLMEIEGAAVKPIRSGSSRQTTHATSSPTSTVMYTPA
ncbi:MAG: hypothetical protein C4K60_14245 [Ideonella sp. MAG2]|nr:MAG: hypothetical protein C4K60_14245 [Ideonella sp. MAG2]